MLGPGNPEILNPKSESYEPRALFFFVEPIPIAFILAKWQTCGLRLRIGGCDSPKRVESLVISGDIWDHKRD